MNEQSIRRLADREGYRLAKARSVRWEGTGYTPPFRLCDTATNLPVADFDGLDDVAEWLK